MDEVVALSDVHVSVKSSERIGLIGLNGACKSTLLRLISGGTAPSHGTILATSVPKLLILAGLMLPSLSVSEDAQLVLVANGHTLKDARYEVEEILANAGLVAMADVPVKTLSAGTRAKLGFIIATVSQPEILLIDEVFSVRDKAFQQIVSARLKRSVNRAQAVVLSSHSKKHLFEFCSRGVVLHEGRLVFDGPIQDA